MKIRTLFAASLLLSGLAAPALAHTYLFAVSLSGPNEFPVNASPGTGSGMVTFDMDLATLRVEVSFSGLIGNTTNSHIHCCTSAPGFQNAGVATMTPTFLGFPSGVTSGSYDATFNLGVASSYNAAFVTANGGTPGSAMNALLAGAQAGKAYLNIHSSSFPGGEIRGFLMPVPEPETYALMGLGLAVVGAAAKRRRA
ncbi:MAG: CHRD domain-containing protein [Burkholderiaceae bacterium]|nr:CHRD domain-containing protein [Burkholderiaceae bacterium]